MRILRVLTRIRNKVTIGNSIKEIAMVLPTDKSDVMLQLIRKVVPAGAAAPSGDIRMLDT